MGPRAGLDRCGKSRPPIRSPDRPVRSQSLYRLSYRALQYGVLDNYIRNKSFTIKNSFVKIFVSLILKQKRIKFAWDGARV